MLLLHRVLIFRTYLSGGIVKEKEFCLQYIIVKSFKNTCRNLSCYELVGKIMYNN